MRLRYVPVLIAALATSGHLKAADEPAADELMTAAQAQFKPIPTTAPELPGNNATPATTLVSAGLMGRKPRSDITGSAVA